MNRVPSASNTWCGVGSTRYLTILAAIDRHLSNLNILYLVQKINILYPSDVLLSSLIRMPVHPLFRVWNVYPEDLYNYTLLLGNAIIQIVLGYFVLLSIIVRTSLQPDWLAGLK